MGSVRPQRSNRQLAKRLVQSALCHFWSAGFAAYGAVTRPQARSFESAGGLRVAVIAPHPDDETAGCGGTLLRHRAAGDEVSVICITDGRRSRAFGLDPATMAARREAEMKAAARVLDVNLIWLGFGEGAWSHDRLVTELRGILGRMRPSIVYTPSRLDFHPEHRAVAAGAAAALVETPEATVRVYPIQVPFRPSMIDRLVPVKSEMPQLEAALDCFQTQRGALEPCRRLRRYLGRWYGQQGEAEGFWELDPASYRRSHGAPGDGGSARGLRHLALTDPWSFLSASGLRHTLLETARATAATRL